MKLEWLYPPAAHTAFTDVMGRLEVLGRAGDSVSDLRCLKESEEGGQLECPTWGVLVQSGLGMLFLLTLLSPFSPVACLLRSVHIQIVLSFPCNLDFKLSIAIALNLKQAMSHCHSGVSLKQSCHPGMRTENVGAG